MSLKSGLYVTATPIGNLKDITLRAIETMQQANVIYCEDTRVTRKLCQAHSIKTPLQAYHDHNGEEVRPEIIKRLEAGEVVVLVSDAGTPLISDPGYKLVRSIRDHELPIFTIPGASATTAALSIAGAPTNQFHFVGFLPSKLSARQKLANNLANLEASLVFYESGPRIAATLKELGGYFGSRTVAVARELTKLYEEVREGSFEELYQHYDSVGAPKGEIVLIVHPAEAKTYSDKDLSSQLTELLKTHRVKDAARLCAEETGEPRKKLYELALQLKADGK